MGEGDVLNSTTNVPQASSSDRFASVNPDRCMSDPHIDLIAFDEDVPAGQLETRIRTRSRGVPDETDNRLGDDYTQLKVAVFEGREESDHTRNIESVLACGLEPLGVHGPAVQTHHQGMSTLRARQDQYDEQVVEIQDTLMCISTTLEKTETSNRELLEEMTSLKYCYNEVSQRLDTDGIQMNNLDKIISRLENKVDDNLETVQDWFVHLTAQSSTEVPREIVETLQDVINDSAPGRAVDKIRDELQDLRESLSMSQHVTDGLRGLIVDMSEQLSNSYVSQAVLDESLRSKDHSTLEIDRRECEIVKKGIQRTEKQLRRLVLNGLEMRPMDISLIRKYKTVDIPCVHAAIGSIQKSLQRYVKFSEMDMQYCEAIDDPLDEAEKGGGVVQ